MKLKIILAGLIACAALAYSQTGAPSTVAQFEVVADSTLWQNSKVEIPAGYVADVAAKGTWKLNPIWKKEYGAGGKPGLKAARDFVKPGANEGALLVSVGDQIFAFESDSQILTISAIGALHFIANDVPPRGFADNGGRLQVSVRLRKAP